MVGSMLVPGQSMEAFWHETLTPIPQSVELHYAVTFQMLHHTVTFDEKWENLPTLVISYKVTIGTNNFLTKYYENVTFQKIFVHFYFS